MERLIIQKIDLENQVKDLRRQIDKLNRYIQEQEERSYIILEDNERIRLTIKSLQQENIELRKTKFLLNE